MSKIKFRSFPQNTAYYTKTAAPESSVAILFVAVVCSKSAAPVYTGVDGVALELV